MTDRATWNARARAGLRFFLIALVAQLLASIALLPLCARFLAPLGFLLPWRGPRAATVSFLLDVPFVAAAAGAAWVLGRVGEGSPPRRAAVLVLVLWLFATGSGLFVNANFDRWLDGWSVTARLVAMGLAWLAARWILVRARPPTPPAAPLASP